MKKELSAAAALELLGKRYFRFLKARLAGGRIAEHRRKKLYQKIETISHRICNEPTVMTTVKRRIQANLEKYKNML